MRKKAPTHDIQCLVCEWKGMFAEAEQVKIGMPSVATLGCPRCHNRRLATPAELADPEYWEIHNYSKREVESLRRKWKNGNGRGK